MAVLACVATALGALVITGCGTAPQPPPAQRAYEYDTAFDASGLGLSQPAGVCVGPSGLVYVVDTGNHRILPLDDTGALSGAPIGHFGSGFLEFDSPTGIAASGGDLFVADTGNCRVQVVTLSGDFVRVFGACGTDAGEFLRPAFLAVSGGSVYVVDSLQPRVQVLSATGVFRRGLGEFGIGPGQFSNPRGVGVSGGTTYVADGGGDRVELFDDGGAFIATFGSPGDGFGELRDPEGLAVDGDDVFVADSANDRIHVFSADGRPLTTFPDASAPRQMSRPTGVAVDSAGRVYVTNADSNQVQRWKPVGG